jgi:hypothetical protein
MAGDIDDNAFVWHDGRLHIFEAITYFSLGHHYSSKAKAINRFGVAAGSDGAYFPCSMSGLQFMTHMPSTAAVSLPEPVRIAL